VQSSAEEIAEGLREQIRGGRLRPGARVPSTRALVRDHGIAMATASKVIAQLRDEGWVVTTPGSGTVVAPAGQVRRRARSEVSADAVVAAAVAVADTEGLEAVSMRRLATELAVSPMALYRHVANKADLVDQMMELAFTTGPLSTIGSTVGPTDPWRRRLEAAVDALWSSFRQHPWLAGAMSTTRPTIVRGALEYSELILAAFADAGCTAREGFTLNLGLLNLVRGLALTLEPEAEAEAATGMDNDEWMDTQAGALLAAIESGQHPHLAALVEHGYPYDVDVILRATVRSFLDGVAWRGRA